MVKFSEEYINKAGENSNPFHDEKEMETPASTELGSTPVKSNNTPIDELHMPTMSNLDELTYWHSTHDIKTPERIDPSATTTVNITDQSSYTTSIMICLVIIGSMTMSSQCSSTYIKFVYHTHLVNERFGVTLN